MKTFAKFLLTGIALAAAVSAGAAETVIDPAVSVNLSGWTYGQGHAANVSSPGFNGNAGGFKGVLSNAGSYDNASFETYCVQIGQTFNWNTNYNNYQIIKGDTYGLWAGNPNTAGQLGQLMTYVDTLGPLTSTQSTGVQMAVWDSSTRPRTRATAAGRWTPGASRTPRRRRTPSATRCSRTS